MMSASAIWEAILTELANIVSLNNLSPRRDLFGQYFFSVGEERQISTESEYQNMSLAG